jgi:hypothetical protein
MVKIGYVNIHIIDTANMFYNEDAIAINYLHILFNAIKKWHKNDEHN